MLKKVLLIAGGIAVLLSLPFLFQSEPNGYIFLVGWLDVIYLLILSAQVPMEGGKGCLQRVENALFSGGTFIFLGCLLWIFFTKNQVALTFCISYMLLYCIWGFIAVMRNNKGNGRLW